MTIEKEWYSSVIEQIKSIDESKVVDSVDDTPLMKVVETQKVYYWIRLYLKEEVKDLKVGDVINITYLKSLESLKTIFVAFGKKNLNRDLDNVIINYDPEDDKKTLCLMVDEDDLKENSDSIPFIRTLFKTYGYYQFQVYKRDDLKFINNRTKESCDYIDVDF